MISSYIFNGLFEIHVHAFLLYLSFRSPWLAGMVKYVLTMAQYIITIPLLQCTTYYINNCRLTNQYSAIGLIHRRHCSSFWSRCQLTRLSVSNGFSLSLLLLLGRPSRPRRQVIPREVILNIINCARHTLPYLSGSIKAVGAVRNSALDAQFSCNQPDNDVRFCKEITDHQEIPLLTKSTSHY